VRLFWYGPNFRYERPQAGRLRQFWQIDVEAIGSDDPALDAEIILYTWRLYEALGLRNLTVLLNSIGDRAARAPYLEALRDYFRPHLERLDRDDQMRFEKNPLRLLDSKDVRTRELLHGAPDLHEALSPASRDHFERVQAYLRAADVPFVIDKRLVRGFDYYTHTVFEVVPPNAGRMGTIGGGGRYDGLIELLGGKPTPAVGVATGVERIVMNMKANGVEPPPLPSPKVFVAVTSPEAAAEAFRLADELRVAGYRTQLAAGGQSLKGQLRAASRLNVRYTLILGEDELAAGTVTVKEMAGGEQRAVPRAGVVRHLEDAVAETGP
jgi:histidyl-tRNA synthetase